MCSVQATVVAVVFLVVGVGIVAEVPPAAVATKTLGQTGLKSVQGNLPAGII